jgi:hypothetical protein
MRFDPNTPDGAVLRERIDQAVCLLCNERQVDLFLCGMAAGFDLFAARRVLDLRQAGRIPQETGLIAVLPYPSHSWDVPLDWQNLHNEVLQCCQDQYVASGEKRADSYRRRNDYMTAHADYVLAYWNHDPRTGTGQTVRMARERDRVILNLYDW